MRIVGKLYLYLTWKAHMPTAASILSTRHLRLFYCEMIYTLITLASSVEVGGFGEKYIHLRRSSKSAISFCIYVTRARYSHWRLSGENSNFWVFQVELRMVFYQLCEKVLLRMPPESVCQDRGFDLQHRNSIIPNLHLSTPDSYHPFYQTSKLCPPNPLHRAKMQPPPGKSLDRNSPSRFPSAHPVPIRPI